MKINRTCASYLLRHFIAYFSKIFKDSLWYGQRNLISATLGRARNFQFVRPIRKKKRHEKVFKFLDGNMKRFFSILTENDQFRVSFFAASEITVRRTSIILRVRGTNITDYQRTVARYRILFVRCILDTFSVWKQPTEIDARISLCRAWKNSRFVDVDFDGR